MAVFALLRAAFPTSYTAALIGAIGISIGQPFLLNAFTKLAALWFPQSRGRRSRVSFFFRCSWE